MHNQFKTQKFKHLMLAMGPRDINSAPYSPIHCSSHSMTSFQSSELTELPVVENGQLFAARAQRTVRPLRPMRVSALLTMNNEARRHGVPRAIRCREGEGEGVPEGEEGGEGGFGLGFGGRS